MMSLTLLKKKVYELLYYVIYLLYILNLSSRLEYATPIIAGSVEVHRISDTKVVVGCSSK